jgi:predicted nucleotidyltransferase
MTAEDILPGSWITAICAWAEDEADIAAVYLFGSYAKGAQREDSDLDLAVILQATDPEHEDDFTRWFFQNEEWSAQLNSLLPVGVDLQLGNAEISKTIVGPAVASYGVPIYRRGD